MCESYFLLGTNLRVLGGSTTHASPDRVAGPGKPFLEDSVLSGCWNLSEIGLGVC